MNKRQQNYYIKVKKILEEIHGCTLLEESYKPAKQDWQFICPCGNVDARKPSDFMHKKIVTCRECGRKRSASFHLIKPEVIEEYFKDKSETLIDSYLDEVSNGRRYTFCEYTCVRGHLNKKPFYLYKAGHICKECAPIDASIRYKRSIEEVREIFTEQGCELLAKEYIDWNTPLKYRCSCGNISKATIGNIKKGIKCGCKYPKGENNHNWNPNLTEEDRLRTRSYPEYIQWIKDVYKRDDYTCQCCFARGVRLESHHIYGYSEYKHLRLNLKNGITLCEICHREFHSIYGLKGFDEKDLNEYIKEIQKLAFGKVVKRIRTNLF